MFSTRGRLRVHTLALFDEFTLINLIINFMEAALNGSKTEELILQEFEEMNTSGDLNEKLTYSQTVN